MKFYEVGGCVRDELLGVKSKDIDFTVVLHEDWQDFWAEDITPFQAMTNYLKVMGFEIFLETPEYLTARARFPKGHANEGTTADFVLARKESGYSDGRRPDEVISGTLLDDLARRDFTMNAIAKDESGNLIDPYGGRTDIGTRTIRAVGHPLDRLGEDALRVMRALRFAVTKEFGIDRKLALAMQQKSVVDSLRDNISDERIREELSKMFRHNTRHSLILLYQYPHIMSAIFDGTVSLDATMKTRGRNHGSNTQ